MFDPFTTWTRTMAAMTGIARTAQRSAECRSGGERLGPRLRQQAEPRLRLRLARLA